MTMSQNCKIHVTTLFGALFGRSVCSVSLFVELVEMSRNSRQVSQFLVTRSGLDVNGAGRDRLIVVATVFVFVGKRRIGF